MATREASAGDWVTNTPSFVKTLPVLDFPFDRVPDLFAPERTVLNVRDGNRAHTYLWCFLRRKTARGGQTSFDPSWLSAARVAALPTVLDRLSKGSRHHGARPASIYSSLRNLGYFLAWADSAEHEGRYEAVLSDPELALQALRGYGRSMTASRDAPVGASKMQRATFRAKALADVVDAMTALGYDPASMAALDHFIAGRLLDHQVTLMFTVVAFSGMRRSEVSILPLEGCLREFEHLGATHYELHGFTHKLNNGQKALTSWITRQQGARAVRLAEGIARAILAETDLAPKAGQQALLFPSTENPYRSKDFNSQAIDTRLNRLREIICPLAEQSDIEELDRLELPRDWQRDDIEVGERWPLAFHQLRRSLAVYAHRSGMVTLPALKAQLQHITQEMTSYYADGFSRAKNLVFDKGHFSHEWNAAKAESSYFGYTLGLLFTDESFFGGVTEQRMSGVVESRSREDTLRLFEQNKLSYRETVLGGCVSTEECKSQPLEPIPYDCLETNCPNMVVFSKRLQVVVRSQQAVVATLERTERGSVEHRLEVRHLEVLLKA